MLIPKNFCIWFTKFSLLVLLAAAGAALALGGYWLSLSCMALNLAGGILFAVGMRLAFSLMQIVCSRIATFLQRQS